jgi:hypothetical protein
MREPWQIHWRDYYDILQVTSTAEVEVIEGAYRRLAAKYHPDKGATADEERMKLIGEAYAILHNPSKRRDYDSEHKRKRPAHFTHSSSNSPLVDVRLSSISGVVSRVGSKYRFCVKVDTVNASNRELGQSGLTISFPSLHSREAYQLTDIHTSALGCKTPFLAHPGDAILSFLKNGSWGERPAVCLRVECVTDEWPKSEHIEMEAVLLISASSLEARVRAWSTKPTGGGFGDPDWNGTKEKDQQGIPAYRLAIGFT